MGISFDVGGGWHECHDVWVCDGTAWLATGNTLQVQRTCLEYAHALGLTTICCSQLVQTSVLAIMEMPMLWTGLVLAPVITSHSKGWSH